MNIVAVIMGGGQGKRLQPLTRDRSKPAVPIGGKYRLVDIPISNCINSGIRRIYLLTQFNSVSLHQHVSSTYRFDQFHSGFVRILAAQQTPSSEVWFQGTADAVRQSMRYLLDSEPDLVVILSGDQLYRMNFTEVVAEHLRTHADVTICTKPVARTEAGALGIMLTDNERRIINFVEKPGDTPELDKLRSPLYAQELFMASMGIYVFNTKVLAKLLDNDMTDFGKGIIPSAINDFRVFSYPFEGYWKDIGTLRSFWEENLALTDEHPGFDFHDPNAPIYTHMRYLPPSKVIGCDINRSLVAEGCTINGHRILHSIIGVRARVGEGSVIEHCVVMGADYYEKSPPSAGTPAIGIGRNCFIRNAIIDKNARIGDGAYISPEGKKNITTDTYWVQDGVIVIPKHAIIHDGTKI